MGIQECQTVITRLCWMKLYETGSPWVIHVRAIHSHLQTRNPPGCELQLTDPECEDLGGEKTALDFKMEV